MPKFFVLSDVHGFYDEMKKALDEAGFDENNPDHWVIGCGDYIDRGPKPFETIKYLYNLPQKVLVRGNHEDLLEACCHEGVAYPHDVQNETAQTITDIAQRNPLGFGYFPEDCSYTLSRTKTFRNSLVNYFETKNYIFVHSWIPIKETHIWNPHAKRVYEFNPDWRNASSQDWSVARWGNPFDMAKKGLLPDKTVVFGHWHCSAGWAEKDHKPEFGEGSDFSPFYGEGYIGIDGCTAYTKKVNVIVLEDEFLDEDNQILLYSKFI